MIALMTGFALVCLLGAFHCIGLIGIRRLLPVDGIERHGPLVLIFVALASLHMVEILLYAGVYAVIDLGGWVGHLDRKEGADWTDYVYFSGINFVTLGYTEIKTDGTVRLIAMLQSLGGFMVLTWSATFVYSVWGRIWSR